MKVKTRKKNSLGKQTLSKANNEKGDPYGTRTRVAAVKGRSPRPLVEGAVWCRLCERDKIAVRQVYRQEPNKKKRPLKSALEEPALALKTT